MFLDYGESWGDLVDVYLESVNEWFRGSGVQGFRVVSEPTLVLRTESKSSETTPTYVQCKLPELLGIV